MPNPAGQKQVLVKVNAPVDKRITPLVGALSEFPEVATYESCQGRRDLAWVQFVRGDWTATVRFVEDELLPTLDAQDGLGALANVTVYGRDSVRVNLYVVRENVEALAGLLTSRRTGRGLAS